MTNLGREAGEDMGTKLNILIGLLGLIALLLAIMIRLEFTIFYQSLPDYRRCDWNWTDGKSSDECVSEINRRAAGSQMDTNYIDPEVYERQHPSR